VESHNGFKFYNRNGDELFGTEEVDSIPPILNSPIFYESSAIKCKESLSSHESSQGAMSSNGKMCDRMSLSNTLRVGEEQ
jgi:hypothetical protein